MVYELDIVFLWVYYLYGFIHNFTLPKKYNCNGNMMELILFILKQLNYKYHTDKNQHLLSKRGKKEAKKATIRARACCITLESKIAV